MKPHVVPGLGKARLAALRWLADKGEASMFGRGDPSLSTIKWLEDAGYVGRLPSRGAFTLSRFIVSPKGRELLSADAARSQK